VQARSKETVCQNQLNAFSRLDRKLKLSLILNAQAKFRFLYRCLIIYSVKVYVVVVDTNLTMRKEKEIKRNIKPTPVLFCIDEVRYPGIQRETSKTPH